MTPPHKHFLNHLVIRCTPKINVALCCPWQKKTCFKIASENLKGLVNECNAKAHYMKFL